MYYKVQLAQINKQINLPKSETGQASEPVQIESRPKDSGLFATPLYYAEVKKFY